MNELSLNELKKYAFSKSFEDKYYSKLESLIEDLQELKFVEALENEVHLFYPKYLWLEKERNLEFFYFTAEKVVQITTEEDDGNINIKTRFTKDIINTDINNLNPSSNDAILTINFKDNSNIVLSSNDTNDAWKNRFFDVILKIHKLVS